MQFTKVREVTQMTLLNFLNFPACCIAVLDKANGKFFRIFFWNFVCVYRGFLNLFATVAHAMPFTSFRWRSTNDATQHDAYHFCTIHGRFRIDMRAGVSNTPRWYKTVQHRCRQLHQILKWSHAIFEPRGSDGKPHSYCLALRAR